MLVRIQPGVIANLSENQRFPLGFPQVATWAERRPLSQPVIAYLLALDFSIRSWHPAPNSIAGIVSNASDTVVNRLVLRRYVPRRSMLTLVGVAARSDTQARKKGDAGGAIRSCSGSIRLRSPSLNRGALCRIHPRKPLSHSRGLFEILPITPPISLGGIVGRPEQVFAHSSVRRCLEGGSGGCQRQFHRTGLVKPARITSSRPDYFGRLTSVAN